jgi:hypothetical protein
MALFILVAGAEYVQAQDTLAEDGKRIRMLARCRMELMKYETMDGDRDHRGMFWMHCIKAEGYDFDPKLKILMLDDKPTCSDLWKRDNFPPTDMSVCWKRIW